MSRSRIVGVGVAAALSLGVLATPVSPVSAAPAVDLSPALLSAEEVTELTGTTVTEGQSLKIKKVWQRTYTSGLGLPRYTVQLSLAGKKKPKVKPGDGLPGGGGGGGGGDVEFDCEFPERTRDRITMICDTGTALLTVSSHWRRRGVSIGVVSMMLLIDPTNGGMVPVTADLKREEAADAQAVREAQLTAVCDTTDVC